MLMQAIHVKVQDRTIAITNPDKMLWPDLEITKLEYIQYLIDMSDYLLPYVKNRLLTTIRYPDGIEGKYFYQKNIPDYAPDWIARREWNGTTYMLLNDLPTLVWLGNQACLEFHVPFHVCDDGEHPSEIAFDLDPSDPDNFRLVLDVALLIKEILDSLGLESVAKTSGATGLQIYIPIKRGYTYAETNKFLSFVAHYLAEKYPHLVTLERWVKKRGNKLYIDYLQHGKGKTLAAPYCLRARKQATVSAPVSWEEVESGFHPHDFTMLNIKERVKKKGDLFSIVTTDRLDQSLDEILDALDRFA